MNKIQYFKTNRREFVFVYFKSMLYTAAIVALKTWVLI